MFAEIKITIKRNDKIMYSVRWCEGMTKDVRREEICKLAALSECTYNIKIYFVGIKSKSVVCHPARNITETVTQIRVGYI